MPRESSSRSFWDIVLGRPARSETEPDTTEVASRLTPTGDREEPDNSIPPHESAPMTDPVDLSPAPMTVTEENHESADAAVAPTEATTVVDEVEPEPEDTSASPDLPQEQPEVAVQQTPNIVRTVGSTDENPERNEHMSSLQQAIQDLLTIEGATGAAIVDLGSGMALATGGNPGFNLDVAAAGNSNVVRAKLKTMDDLGLHDEVEDILITLGKQYHLVNVLNEDDTKGLFIYLVLNRTSANLALARHKMNQVAHQVNV